MNAMCHNTDHQLDARPQLPKTFLCHLILLLEPAILQQLTWINEYISLDTVSLESLDMFEMYQLPAIFLFSQLSSMSMEKCLEVFTRLGHHCLPIERMIFITANLHTHSPTIDGRNAGGTWMCRRDKTQKLAAFESMLCLDRETYFLIRSTK